MRHPQATARANHRPMDAPARTAAQPLPAHSACIRCAYDLAGLSPDGNYPECGLAVAASWPAWDLTACHRVYVEHVRAEVRSLGWAAVLACLVAMGFALALRLEPWANRSVPASDAQAVAATVAVVALIVMAIPLVRFDRQWRAHPERGKAMARGPRRASNIGLWVMAIGMVAMLLPGGFIAQFAPALGTPVASAGAAVMLAGGAACYVAMMGYAHLALERGGRKAPARWHEWVWLLLALVGLVPLLVWRHDPVYVWWWSAATLLGVAAAMAVLAGRCARASAAIERR
jgi:hypothetical protein